MKLRLISLIGILFLIVGCNKRTATRLSFQNGVCMEDPTLNGLSKDKVIKKLGHPKEIDTFRIVRGKEYLGALPIPDIFFHNYPLGDTINVIEFYWRYDTSQRRIWFKEEKGVWISKENLLWGDDIVF